MSLLLGMSGGAAAAIVVAVLVGGGAVVTAAGLALRSIAHHRAKEVARKPARPRQTDEGAAQDAARPATPVEIPPTRGGGTADKYDLDIMTTDGMTNRLTEDRNGVTDEDVQSELSLILDKTQADEIDDLLKGK